MNILTADRNEHFRSLKHRVPNKAGLDIFTIHPQHVRPIVFVPAYFMQLSCSQDDSDDNDDRRNDNNHNITNNTTNDDVDHEDEDDDAEDNWGDDDDDEDEGGRKYRKLTKDNNRFIV